MTSDHSKRGRRFVSILDPETRQVTLLEPWEHAVLVLSDGTRNANAIAELLESGIEGEAVDLRAVERCLKYFARERLLSRGVSQRMSPDLPLPGPRTLAGLQQAYREWHKDPVRTGQILSGLIRPPYLQPDSSIRAGLAPTVALPDDDVEDGKSSTVPVGATLHLADAEGVLAARKRAGDQGVRSREDARTIIGPLAGESTDGSPLPGESASPGAAIIAEDEFDRDSSDQEMARLLEAVDEDFEAVESREAAAALSRKQRKAPPPLGKAIAGETRPPETRELLRPLAKVLMSVEPDPAVMKKLGDIEERSPSSIDRPPTHRSLPLSESALRPTMVGVPPPEGSDAKVPVLLAPKRSPLADEATAKLSVVEESRGEDQGPEIGLLVGAESPTEGSIAAYHPDSNDGRAGGGHLPGHARDVFDRLRRAGLRARARPDREVDRRQGQSGRHARRRDDDGARRFDAALKSLTAGDLDLALQHFRRLQKKMPESTRLAGFVAAIEEVVSGVGGLDGEQSARPTSPKLMLESFEDVLEEAVAYGRCPACFSMVAKNFTRCFACGFALGA